MNDEKNQMGVSEELQEKGNEEEMSEKRQVEILEKVIARNIFEMELVINQNLFEDLKSKLSEERRRPSFLLDVVDFPELFLLYKKVLLKKMEELLS